jgi:hypothetical protein
MRGVLLPLSYILIATGLVVVLGVMAWAGRRARPPVSGNEQSLLFRYSAALRWFAIFAAFGIPIGITLLVVAYPPRGKEVWYVIGVYALFAALSVPLFWETSRYYVRLTPTGIERRSAWGGLRSCDWDDLQEVRYSPLNSWFVFVAVSGEKIRVHTLLAGLNDLFQFVESRVPADRLRHARKGYERLRRPFPWRGDEPVLEPRRPRRIGEW